jgi:single-strand DNA-binding protein
MSVCSFTVAVDRPRNKDGVKEADFIRCKAFGKQGESIAYYKGKGDMIAVDGRLQTGSYEKDGIRHYTTDVIVERADFLSKEKHAQSDEKQPSNASNAFDAIGDDDIPW